jgi:hypothetical protein
VRKCRINALANKRRHSQTVPTWVEQTVKQQQQSRNVTFQVAAASLQLCTLHMIALVSTRLMLNQGTQFAPTPQLHPAAPALQKMLTLPNHKTQDTQGPKDNKEGTTTTYETTHNHMHKPHYQPGNWQYLPCGKPKDCHRSSNRHKTANNSNLLAAGWLKHHC